MSQIGRALSVAITKGNWREGEYTTSDVDTGMRLWTANGGFFFKIWEIPGVAAEVDVGLVERHYLYWKLRRVTRQQRVDARRERRDRKRQYADKVVNWLQEHYGDAK